MTTDSNATRNSGQTIMKRLIALLSLFSFAAFGQVYEGHSPGRLIDAEATDLNARWHPHAVTHVPDIRAGDVYQIIGNAEVLCQCGLGYFYNFALAASELRPDSRYRDAELFNSIGGFIIALGGVTVSGYADGEVTRSQSYLWQPNDDYPNGLFIFGMGRASGDAAGATLAATNEYIQVYKLSPSEAVQVQPDPEPDPLEPIVLETQEAVREIAADVARLKKRVRRLAR